MQLVIILLQIEFVPVDIKKMRGSLKGIDTEIERDKDRT